MQQAKMDKYAKGIQSAMNNGILKTENGDRTKD
jgi:hypothetical protein